MRYLVVVILLVLSASCFFDKNVHVSGRIEGLDTVVTFFVEKEQYIFEKDANGQFSGKIPLKRGTYGRVHNQSVYLSPGENLEVYLDNSKTNNITLQYKGSLGAINTYMNDQKNFNIDYNLFKLDEKQFVQKMHELINSSILMMEAKNFKEDFNKLERIRIRYNYAFRAIFYPSYQQKDEQGNTYNPTKVFNDFISEFDIDNEEYLNIPSFRNFVVNYIFYQGRYMTNRQLINYVLTHVESQGIKDILLADIIYRHVRENGLQDSDYLLSICWNEVSDTTTLVKLKDLMDQWRKLSRGATAPNLILSDLNEERLQLKDLRGEYLYICVYAAWNNPFTISTETWNAFAEEYSKKGIRFTTLAFDKNTYTKIFDMGIEGNHFFLENQKDFLQDYVISKLPRYILIDKNGRLISVDAPEPSNSLKLLFAGIGI